MYHRFFALFTLLAVASAASTNCGSSSLIERERYTSPDGIEFMVTTSTCEAELQTRNVAYTLDNPLSLGIIERDTSECEDPDICVCGSQCNPTGCFDSPAGTVQLNHCTRLSKAIRDTLKGTFFLSGGTVKTTNSGSCEFLFHNEGSTELEYCWDDLARLGLASSKACPARQAICQFQGSSVMALFSQF